MSSTQYLTPYCTTCYAYSGITCVTGSGKKCKPHKARINDAAKMETALASSLVSLAGDYDLEQKHAEREEIIVPLCPAYTAITADVFAEVVEPTEADVPFGPARPHSAFESKQSLYLIKDGAETWNRTRAYADCPRKPDVSFAKRELRSFLERNAPCEFAIVSGDDLEEMHMMLSQRLKYSDDVIKIDFDGKLITGFVTKGGQSVTLIYGPDGITLKDLNVKMMLRATTDIGKYMKYLKRLCAPYVSSVQGPMIRYDIDAATDKSLNKCDILKYTMNGKEQKIRFESPLPDGIALEGCSWASADWCNDNLGPVCPETGKPWAIGDAARITIICSRWLWKGQIGVHPDSDRLKHVGLSLWDCKTIIGTVNGDVFVGFMGCLHAGDLRLGMQDIVDFGLMWYAKELGILAIDSFAEAIRMQDRGKQIFENMNRNNLSAIANPDEDDSKVLDAIKSYRLMNALYAGFQYNQNPFMQGDDANSFTKSVCNVKRGSIPVPRGMGIAAYAMCDPWIINEWGIVDLSLARMTSPKPEPGAKAIGRFFNSEIPDGIESVVIRTPHAPYEQTIMISCAPPVRYGKDGKAIKLVLINKAIMVLSVDMMRENLLIWGGADLDDRMSMFLDPRIVHHFRFNLPFYPPKLTKDKNIAASVAKAGSRLVDKYKIINLDFDMAALSDKIRESMEADTNIGRIDNFMRVSYTLSVYFNEIIDFIKDLIAQDEDGSEDLIQHQAALHYMQHDFKRYGERIIASFFEESLDGILLAGSKGGRDVSVGKLIDTFWENCRVVPYWATVGGKDGGSKIPTSVINPTVVMDPISLCIKELEVIADDLQVLVKTQEWVGNGQEGSGVQRADSAIQNYPITPFVRAKVAEGLKSWSNSMRKRNLACNVDGKPLTAKQGYKSFRKICDAHRARLDHYGTEFSMMYMAELERIATKGGPYKNPVVFEGKVRIGPDRYLNNPAMFELRVELHQRLGLLTPLDLHALSGGLVENPAPVVHVPFKTHELKTQLLSISVDEPEDLFLSSGIEIGSEITIDHQYNWADSLELA